MNGAARRTRLARARLYLVVDEAACAGAWPHAVARALSSGAVDVVQLRAKDLDDDAYVVRAGVVRALLRGASGGAETPLLVLNDRVHLVARCDADGAHVGEHDLAPEAARAVLGPERLLGLSTHDRAEVAAAAGRGADHVGLGPCFPSTTKALRRPPAGPALVAACEGATTLPVFPIGGITPGNVASLVAAGARRAAVGAGVLAAPDPAAAARAIADALR